MAVSLVGDAADTVRARLVDTLRCDLIGPGPEDADLAREVLQENPSRWYLTGFLVPSPEQAASRPADSARGVRG